MRCAVFEPAMLNNDLLKEVEGMCRGTPSLRPGSLDSAIVLVWPVSDGVGLRRRCFSCTMASRRVISTSQPRSLLRLCLVATHEPLTLPTLWSNMNTCMHVHMYGYACLFTFARVEISLPRSGSYGRVYSSWVLCEFCFGRLLDCVVIGMAHEYTCKISLVRC